MGKKSMNDAKAYEWMSGFEKKITGRITSLFYFITSNQNDIIFKIPSTFQIVTKTPIFNGYNGSIEF